LAAKKYHDKYLARARELGLCRRCKKARPSEGYITCEPCRIRCGERATAWRKANPRPYLYKLRDAVFKKYGDKCVMCGFSDRRALQFDHVKGDGNEERRNIPHNGAGYGKYWKGVLAAEEGKYQLLCANCHCIKTHVERGYHTWRSD
jgi:hypothetical protein